MLAGVTRVFGAFRRQHRIAARPDSFFQLSQIRLFLAVHVCPRAGHVRLSPVSVHAVDGIFHTARAICTHHAVYFQNSMIGIMAPVPVRHAHLFFCRLPFAAAAAALPKFLCIEADTEAHAQCQQNQNARSHHNEPPFPKQRPPQRTCSGLYGHPGRTGIKTRHHQTLILPFSLPEAAPPRL